jgi:hypothetical protein
MLTPGFMIRNDTQWRLQISLAQAAPLYFGVIRPGEVFRRDTGSVWFTIRAAVFLDENDRITNWSAIVPVTVIVGTVLAAAVTGGMAALAKGGALAAAGAAGVAGVTGPAAAGALATATVASKLVGIGLTASTSLVIGGAVVGGGVGTAISASAQAAFQEVFKRDNMAVTRAGMYAGPPWPFRKNVPLLAVTGGPRMRAVEGKDQIELSGSSLRIGAAEERLPYHHFGELLTTTVPRTDVPTQFALASNRDIFVIDRMHHATQLLVLSAASGYKQVALNTRIPLGPIDDNWDFSVAPNRDLFAVKKRNTDSGRTEVHVLAANTNYQRFSLQTGVPHPPTGNWFFAVAENRDLFGIKKSNVDSGRTEVHVMAADVNYQKHSLQTGTALAPTDDTWTFGVAANRDVFAIKQRGTRSRTTEVQILGASTNYQQFVLQTRSALGETDPSWSFGIAQNRDILCIKRASGAIRAAEIHALIG